jgi:hypothetical protein
MFQSQKLIRYFAICLDGKARVQMIPLLGIILLYQSRDARFIEQSAVSP